MKLNDMSAAGIDNFTDKYGGRSDGTGSEAGEVDSGTQGRVGMFAHPTCLLDAYQLFGLLVREKLPAATRAYTGQILLVRRSGTMWARRRWRNIYKIVEVKGVCPRSGWCRMVSFVLR